jgi:hypothetical protein
MLNMLLKRQYQDTNVLENYNRQKEVSSHALRQKRLP